MKVNFDELSGIFEAEGNLVTPEKLDRLVLVGDTHGDLQSTRKVFDRYQKPGTTITFLGDYVDRGPKSEENINYLLEKKLDNPDSLYLLQGNHEGMKYREFGPVNFWNDLSPGERERYQDLLAKLPLAFSWDNLIATHGALPDVNDLEDIDGIDGGDRDWEKITWGDLNEVEGYILGGGFGRPQLGSDYFNQKMDQLEKEVLVRSHQPNVPTHMFDGRCITIFTSSAYGTSMNVAVVEGSVSSSSDVTLETI